MILSILTREDARTDGQTLVERFGNSRLVPVVYAALMLVMPFLFAPGLVIEIMILGLFAMSFNILFGITGLLSFGHALFFGTGAYVAGYISITAGYPMVVVLGIVILTAIVLSIVVGALSLQLSDVYFAIITLAFAQFGHEMAYVLSEYTGGSDGMTGITRSSPFGLAVIDVTEIIVFAYVVVFFTLVIGLFLYGLSNSLFGRTLKSIRENEDRTKTLGVNTYRVKVVAFVVAGTVAAIAGMLWSMYLQFIDPAVLYWTLSGDAVVSTILGGMTSVFGPLVGTALLHTIEDQLFTTQPGPLSVTTGGLLVLIVLFSRSGVLGILKGVLTRLLDRVLATRE